MFILRYLFLFLILISSTSIGFLISKKYANRVNELVTFSNLINILQNKIRFTKVPLSEVFEEIGNIKTNNTIASIFLVSSQKIKFTSCEAAWNKAIEEKENELSLKEEDFNLIKKLGNTLGRTDIEGQMSEINQFNTLLQMQIKKAEDERKKNEKMYRSLGTIIGLAIVILIF